MAYLHCHSCDWSQDDFYSVGGYNPSSYLSSWMKSLCEDKIDEPFTDDALFIKENGNISRREVIAKEFEGYAKRIRGMKWITMEQWERDKDAAVCPKCGARNFDID